MGDYNPDGPAILGQEWVPIRQSNYNPDELNEVGYSFTLDQSATIVSGYYYIQQPPPNLTSHTIQLISVYPAGAEDDTGPMQQIILPVNGVTVSGGAGTIQFASVQGLLYTNDLDYTQFGVGNANYLCLQFDVASAQQALQNRRITNVEFLYTISGPTDSLASTSVFSAPWNQLGSNITHGVGLIGPEIASFNTDIQSYHMGDVNGLPFIGVGASIQPNVFPWRWEELNRYDVSAPLANKAHVVVSSYFDTGGSVLLQYAALRVTYCNERRLLYGGDHSIDIGATENSYKPGPRPILLRTPALAAGATLAPGAYTVTHSNRFITSPSGVNAIQTPPTCYALEELYALQDQKGVRIKQTTVAGDTFTAEQTSQLPMLSLHTAVAAVTGIHAYGQQIAAPVYTGVNAAQVLSANGFTGGAYPQVRFYARRFGHTTAALALTNGTRNAAITVAAFDALPELVDGWKEVTLRLDTSPDASGVASTWTFSAAGATYGNRWEILGGDASPAPGSPQQLDAATYLAPTGGTQRLTWQSPVITGTAADTSADLALIFSQDPTTPTGVTVTQQSQAITGVAQPCGLTPREIPTAIAYNQLQWNPLMGCDDFNRTVLSGLGNNDMNQTYTYSNASASWSVANGMATLVPVVNSPRAGIISGMGVGDDIRTRINFNMPVLALGDFITIRCYARVQDASNGYYARADFKPDGTVDLRILKIVAGSSTSLLTVSNIDTYSAGDNWAMEFDVTGSTLRARAWKPISGFVPTWQATLTGETTFTTGSGYGFGGVPNTANTNPAFVLNFFDVTAYPVNLLGGSLEIQRLGAVDNIWQTIYDGALCRYQFADYEARVGIQSSYRLRTHNVLDFIGSWSATGTGTIPSPGVTVQGNGVSTLIFTSNRDPSKNLAYPMTWDGTPAETFAFPEVDTQTFQRLYGRDYQVAFRPLERGGEQFDRVILVNNAAIPPQSLADFKGLRDLAWADLPYVCVRDELGNRWFANILVPAGTAQKNRTIYLAQIRVTQVTDTPAPVLS